MCKIVNWRNNLKFPDEAKLTPEAKDIISRLLCDVEHRLGTRGVAEIKVGWSSELVAQSFKRSTVILRNLFQSYFTFLQPSCYYLLIFGNCQAVYRTLDSFFVIHW